MNTFDELLWGLFHPDWYFQRKISGRARVKYCQELAEEATGHWTVTTGSKDWYNQRKISGRGRVKYFQELAEEATGQWTVTTGSKDWYIQRKISARARLEYPQELPEEATGHCTHWTHWTVTWCHRRPAFCILLQTCILHCVYWPAYLTQMQFVTGHHISKKMCQKAFCYRPAYCMLQFLYRCCSVLLRVRLKLFFGLVTMSQCHVEESQWREGEKDMLVTLCTQSQCIKVHCSVHN